MNQAEPHPLIPEIPLSSTKPTPGRIVHVFYPQRWVGPRPGHVVNSRSADSIGVAGSLVNVCVMLDIEEDADLLRRSRPHTGEGSGDVLTRGFSRLPFYDALDPAQRPKVGPWAEWMQYQVGQAKRTDAAESKLTPVLMRMYDLLENLVDLAGEKLPEEQAARMRNGYLLSVAAAMDQIDPAGDRAAALGVD